MAFLSDHLLRTMAAVPIGARVLALGAGSHAGALARLGFETHACAVSEAAVSAMRADVAAVVDAEMARQRVVPVLRLDALGYPDAFFGWVIAYDLDMPAASLPEILAEARRVLQPGGWLYAAVDLPDGGVLDALMDAADLARAEAPEILDAAPRRLVRGIYRRVEPGTPL